MKYDKTGAAFELDHEINGVSYVRPMIKVVMQSTSYSGDDFHEEQEFEAAEFLVARKTSELFDVPPVEVVDAEIKAKRDGLQQFLADAECQKKEAQRATQKANRELAQAKIQLEKWRAEHKVMADLGRLMDGEVLYPLSVSENHYHKARDIPRIPKMSGAKYLSIHSGDFEKGQKWVCKSYATDTYGSPFRFFDSEEERAAVIAAEFEATCEMFRKGPAFDHPKHTTNTRLSYTTLQEWVNRHPTLEIPADIDAMKAEHDAEMARKKRDQLAAQLAEFDDSAA